MPSWFYYDDKGQKQGPITSGQLKELARQGTITTDTKVETEDGKSAPAKKIRGLTFAESAPLTPVPLPPLADPLDLDGLMAAASSAPSRPLAPLAARTTLQWVV